jgi:hypothetical protein
VGRRVRLSVPPVSQTTPVVSRECPTMEYGSSRAPKSQATSHESSVQRSGSDEFSFVKYIKNIGRAYRKQAMEPDSPLPHTPTPPLMAGTANNYEGKSFDKFSFIRHMKNIGRAYRKQAIELVSTCRVFVQVQEQTPASDAMLRR